RKQSSLSNELILGLKSITASNFSWRDPLATIILEICRRFIANFNEYQMESLPDKLKHDSS
ncbi:15161_t:CDS:2, partial [Funneliformis caledonium]